MRVDFIAEQVCSRVPGGTGRYAAQLLRSLVELDEEGLLDIHAITGRPCAAVQSLAPKTSTLSLPGPALARLWERGLPPLVGGSADVVHAPTLLMPPVRHSRLVVTLHDVIPWTHPETLTQRGVAFHRRMGARAAMHADLIITPTEIVAAQVRDILDPRGEVCAIPLGVTPLSPPEDSPQRRAALGIGGRPYALFVGTREPRKGLDVLLQAMTAADCEDLDLVVVGASGWGKINVEDMSRGLGVAERVHLVGGVPDATLAALYNGAAVLALPSRAEGFGIPVIEGMSLGIPVVTSTDGALVETGGGYAWTAPVGDVEALARALALARTPTPTQQARIQAARAHAAGFTWEGTARRTLDAYATVAG